MSKFFREMGPHKWNSQKHRFLIIRQYCPETPFHAVAPANATKKANLH